QGLDQAVGAALRVRGRGVPAALALDDVREALELRRVADHLLGYRLRIAGAGRAGRAAQARHPQGRGGRGDETGSRETAGAGGTRTQCGTKGHHVSTSASGRIRARPRSGTRPVLTSPENRVKDPHYYPKPYVLCPVGTVPRPPHAPVARAP